MELCRAGARVWSGSIVCGYNPATPRRDAVSAMPSQLAAREAGRASETRQLQRLFQGREPKACGPSHRVSLLPPPRKPNLGREDNGTGRGELLLRDAATASLPRGFLQSYLLLVFCGKLVKGEEAVSPIPFREISDTLKGSVVGEEEASSIYRGIPGVSIEDLLV